MEIKTDRADEMLPVVDEAGNIVGSATRGECHDGSRRFLHPVVHLHVFDPHGRIYLQKRPEWKDIQPGRWDTAVGGHVDLGENFESALRREAREELELKEFESEPLDTYLFESNRERELVSSHVAIVDAEKISPSEELDGGRFWTRDEIETAIGKGTLTPNFEDEYRRSLRHLAWPPLPRR